jgi:hypothetical protein
MTNIKRLAIVGIGLVLAIAVAVGAFWFQPWKLWTNTTVNEAPPLSASEPMRPPAEPAVVPADFPNGPTVVARGTFISHEHATSGTVKVLRLSDGSAVVRVENLSTSEGPKLQVVLTDAPVIAGSDGWHVFDDGRLLDLGPLKGNKGSANYPVPAGADITGLSSVSIWCDRFDVSFGAAALEATTTSSPGSP